MLKTPPINYSRIEELAEGDKDFKAELVFAIHTSLLDLKTQYLEGAKLQDDEIIQMIRHKIKPTLSLFDMEMLTETINKGKELIEKNGFDYKFFEHLEEFKEAVDHALEEATLYMAAIKK